MYTKCFCHTNRISIRILSSYSVQELRSKNQKALEYCWFLKTFIDPFILPKPWVLSCRFKKCYIQHTYDLICTLSGKTINFFQIKVDPVWHEIGKQEKCSSLLEQQRGILMRRTVEVFKNFDRNTQTKNEKKKKN